MLVPRYFDDGAETLMSTLCVVLPPPNSPVRHAKSAAMTTIKKITKIATKPVLLELSLSAIVSNPPFCYDARRDAVSTESKNFRTKKIVQRIHYVLYRYASGRSEWSQEKGVPEDCGMRISDCGLVKD
jgi:hypothetical protein